MLFLWKVLHVQSKIVMIFQYISIEQIDTAGATVEQISEHFLIWLPTWSTKHNQKLMQLYARTDRYHYSFLLQTIPDRNNCYEDFFNRIVNWFVCTLVFLPLMGTAN